MVAAARGVAAAAQQGSRCGAQGVVMRPVVSLRGLLRGADTVLVDGEARTTVASRLQQTADLAHEVLGNAELAELDLRLQACTCTCTCMHTHAPCRHHGMCMYDHNDAPPQAHPKAVGLPLGLPEHFHCISRAPCVHPACTLRAHCT